MSQGVKELFIEFNAFFRGDDPKIIIKFTYSKKQSQ